MFELFKLVGRVMVDASGANQALEGTDKKAQGVTGNLGGYMDKLKGWAQAAGAAIAASAIVKGIRQVWDISSQVAEIGDNIDKASQKFLMSAQAYQEWDYIAKMSGTTIESVGAAVYELSKKVAEGGDETLSLLEEIGVSAADAMTSTPEDLFSMVVAGLQNVEDTGRRAYIADALMGGSAQELETIFSSTQKALEELVAKQKELGGVMSDELVKMSADFKDAETNMTEALDGVKFYLAEKTLPGMTQIVDGLTKMLTGDFSVGVITSAQGMASFLEGILVTFGSFAVNIAKEFFDSVTYVAESSYAFGKMFFNPTVETSEEMNAFLNGGQPFSEQDANLIPKLISLREDYLAAGGSEFAFIAETTEKYGAEIADQLIAALAEGTEEINGATDNYVASIRATASKWDEATENIGLASDEVVAAMTSVSENFFSPERSSFFGDFGGNLGNLFSHANGLDFVPRDDYPARLHYGEQVLTKQEADDYRAGKAGNGNITINISTTSQSPAQTAAAITAALTRARWAM